MPFRLATLALALAAARASVRARAGASRMPPPIDAQKIEGVERSRGHRARHGRDPARRITVFGEFLRYNREFGRARGDGGVRLQSGVDRFFGPRLQYNTLDDTGVFESPAFLQRERPARGSAERLEFLGSDNVTS